MIGVIGSPDSVKLVVRVAEEMDLGEDLITRAYEHPEEAPAFAAEIDPACNVILFTGRVPHSLAHERVHLTAATDYIPHSGVDLFRTLVTVVRDYEGKLPKVSIDTIERRIVTENFEEVGEPAPEHVFALDPLLAEGASGTSAIAEFHSALYERGEVALCITCLSSVRDALQARGVPVLRVEHTHSAVRDSLHRARLTSQVQRLEASQVAIATAAGGAGDAVTAAFEDVAAAASGRVVEAPDDGAPPTMQTTRGAIERELAPGNVALRRALDGLAAAGAWLAVGYGHSPEQAQEQARYAHTVASATRDHHVVLPDGSTRRLVGDTHASLRVRDIDPGLQSLARSGGIGPMTLARLQAALVAVGRSDVTAKELSRAYGVEPRSARRLLNAMAKAGLAEPVGAQSAPRGGRPQVIYKIDVEGLLRDSTPADVPGVAEDAS